ncbi:malto-oligosyltrehalose trehalohydrolase [Ramlibacter sp. PS4R-6]|uniref:malto-oligosyltrehalose trehalohydrolase n=1 Tax=Ramlibacter sp. PS4R-6 TaxID=3133438 RepID=UPI0030AAF985
MRCSHEMPFGATPLPGGGVVFRLWGPTARQAEVATYPGAGATVAQFHAAECDSQGWWECTVEEASAGTLYQWRIDHELLVPDPASRQNPYGVFAPSAVVDPLQFEWDGDWRGRPWNEVVLYELHTGTFTREGTFDAACERLESLAQLGITAIELMPVADFPGRFGWGYDGVLPFAPHERYGTPDRLKHFIQQAHRLGLMVFLDVVYNHFGPSGNFLGRYAPQFFSETHASPWGAAINYDGPLNRVVRDFFVHNALYWVQEFRIDGLRLDAVHAIVDKGRTHILKEISDTVRAATAGRHVHLVLENENNEYAWLAPRAQPSRYDAQWNDDFHHVVHVALTGETQRYYHDYGDEPLNHLARCLTHGMLYEPSERREGGARIDPREAPAQPLGALVNFAHNHDQTGNRPFGERLRQLVPPGAAPLATLLALLTPAIPMLFFGEEFGSATPFLYFADWEGDLRDAVREGRKREFGHVAQAALPDPCSPETFDASRPDEAQRDSDDGRRWLEMVQEALRVRRLHFAPRHHLLATGSHTAHRVGETGIEACWRYEDGQAIVLQLNVGPQPVTAKEPSLALVEPQVLFSHAWPDGTAEGVWPAWSARWWMGAQP